MVSDDKRTNSVPTTKKPTKWRNRMPFCLSTKPAPSFLDTDAGEAHLEDADAVEFHLLTQFEEVLHGGSQLVEHCDDVASLHACLKLDVLGECLGPDEVLVVDCLGEVLAACVGTRVCVLLLDKFLTHSFCVFLMVSTVAVCYWPLAVSRLVFVSLD